MELSLSSQAAFTACLRKGTAKTKLRFPDGRLYFLLGFIIHPIPSKGKKNFFAPSNAALAGFSFSAVGRAGGDAGRGCDVASYPILNDVRCDFEN